jgi:hypothetical protein
MQGREGRGKTERRNKDGRERRKGKDVEKE